MHTDNEEEHEQTTNKPINRRGPKAQEHADAHRRGGLRISKAALVAQACTRATRAFGTEASTLPVTKLHLSSAPLRQVPPDDWPPRRFREGRPKCHGKATRATVRRNRARSRRCPSRQAAWGTTRRLIRARCADSPRLPSVGRLESG